MAAFDVRFLPVFAFGLIGGIAAFMIGVPMPFMLGGIVGAAGFVLWYERAGADLRVVTAQHFIRIILVVTSIPLLFLFIKGDAVGSLAGLSLANSEYDFFDIALLLAIALTGLFIGQLTKLPVSHMLGPLLLALVLSVGGIIEINIPPWLGHAAQFMVGTALGAQFSGVSRRLLMRGLGMGLLAGAYMLLLAAAFAYLLVQFVPADFGAMFISFAAGGLAEMSLIALSLNFNPVVVALHHLVRILLTVYVGNFLSRRVFKLV